MSGKICKGKRGKECLSVWSVNCLKDLAFVFSENHQRLLTLKSLHLEETTVNFQEQSEDRKLLTQGVDCLRQEITKFAMGFRSQHTKEGSKSLCNALKSSLETLIRVGLAIVLDKRTCLQMRDRVVVSMIDLNQSLLYLINTTSSTPNDEESLAGVAGVCWTGCDNIKNLPLTNHEACMVEFTEWGSTISDALTELKSNMDESVGGGQSEHKTKKETDNTHGDGEAEALTLVDDLGDMDLNPGEHSDDLFDFFMEEESDYSCSDEEKKVILICASLIEICRDMLIECGNRDIQLHFLHLHPSQISSAVDELVLSCCPPQDCDEVKKCAGVLRTVVREFLKDVSNNCDDQTKGWAGGRRIAMKNVMINLIAALKPSNETSDSE